MVNVLNPEPGRCVCLDCEFADGRELLELSVFDISGVRLYGSRFKPRSLRRWMREPHHITPSMVADSPKFAACVDEIQQLADKARYVVGFAVSENDMPKLSQEGVRGLDDKMIGDVRDIFWLVEGCDRGLDLYQGRSLASCCSELGVALGADAHSAEADTRATLECFTMLLDRYAARIGGTPDNPLDFETVMQSYCKEFADAKFEYDKERASGWVCLISQPEGYRLKIRRVQPDAGVDDVALSVAVGDRKLAENDIRNYLRNKTVPGVRDTYRLTDGDLRKLSRYSNVYDPALHSLVGGVARLRSHFTGRK